MYATLSHILGDTYIYKGVILSSIMLSPDQQHQREIKIMKISKLIEKIVSKFKVVSYRQFSLMVMDEFSVGTRTCSDYVGVALNRLNLKREDIFEK
ncbi:hypothetical protein LCGC14_1142970 [marine sediment metagenome]|uniref:Uncharacterized protein n=1 Tax=marine sediment metagenome TaxID=412755 RepID=A0A0F9M2J5_9ZZZZ